MSIIIQRGERQLFEKSSIKIIIWSGYGRHGVLGR
jgi:hypothetical protein